MAHKFAIGGELVVRKSNPWLKIGRTLTGYASKVDIKKPEFWSGLPPWTGDGTKVHGATADVNKVFKYIAKKLKGTALYRVLGLGDLMSAIADGAITKKEDLDKAIDRFNARAVEAKKEKILKRREETTPRFKALAALLT